uniref:Uncharacterized protein n=1 Tax=Tanacetum cinerariifolium TaxID=118510 RepID=A0A6L2K0I4_TANCI|nr:hypothetical protein [Tanacetum cinerariifolium]
MVQDKGTSWIQEDSDIQGRISADIEILLDQEEPTELVKDLGSGEKREKEISTIIPKGKIDQGVESTVPVELHYTPTNAPLTSQPPTLKPFMQTTYDAEEPTTMPHDKSLLMTKMKYGAAYTKLILRVKKLEHKVKTSQHRRRARVGRISADIEILLDQEEPTELVKDLGSGEKHEKEISTIIPEVSTAVENLVYIKRSAEKRKDKGKAIMEEDKSIQKKSKKQLEQE